jgi:hypothetical protein
MAGSFAIRQSKMKKNSYEESDLKRGVAILDREKKDQERKEKQKAPRRDKRASIHRQRGGEVMRPGAKIDGADSHRSGPGHRLTFLRMPGVNRQGQAHIVSSASPLRSIDPQPASISPTINISIVFICTFFVDCGRIICRPAIKNAYSGFW